MSHSLFTDSQLAILQILVEWPDRALTLSELGRMLGKAPGVFQRGLNALEESGLIISQRRANLRLVRINTASPFYEPIATVVRRHGTPLPTDVYMAYADADRREPMHVSEPPGAYSASALKLLIIAGPNGAGKTTFAREYLPQEAGCHVFINADYIAHGLSPFSPELAALKAGKVMLNELAGHIAQRHHVAVETTLSGRRYAHLIPQWQAQGYAVKLIFLSLPSVDLALARVMTRVRQGGHAIPEETVRRRFKQGRDNFNGIYKPLVDAWAHYDNSGPHPVLIDEEER
jgi:predicted ABC-type ATPase/DNA-binding transcriptional ArsR family regulator